MDNSLEEFYKEYHVNLIILFGVIVVIYIGIFTLFNNFSFNTPQSRPWIILIELIMWGLFVLILYLNIKHFSVFDIKFKDILYNLFGTKRTEMEIHVHKPNTYKKTNINNRDISNNTVSDKYNLASENHNSVSDISNNKTEKCSDITEDGEVFHIPDNKYGYEEASEVCKLFDARLASYDEIEDAYKKGANWCSYGWSSDQLALFPIQKSMYNELKKIPGHERDCGRTGINGGFMEDKKLKFGVNCYGKKPYASEDDLEYMKKFSYSNAYPDEELKAIEKKKEKIKKLLVAPFNKEKWNED
jgi:hypothetical protein